LGIDPIDGVVCFNGLVIGKKQSDFDAKMGLASVCLILMTHHVMI
jgi:hypothetical protein